LGSGGVREAERETSISKFHINNFPNLNLPKGKIGKKKKKKRKRKKKKIQKELTLKEFISYFGKKKKNQF
jgi:hypothetical protein